MTVVTGAMLPTVSPPRDELARSLPAGVALPHSAPGGDPASHPAAVYLARLAPGSRRTMRQALDVVAGLVSGDRHDASTLPWASLRYQHSQAVRAALAERYAPATANKLLAALRGVLREAWRLGQLDAEAYHRAADVEGLRSTTLPRGRALPRGQLDALLAVCAADERPSGPRDGALIALLYGVGLRRSEAVDLDVADVDPETGAVTIRQGKGRKARVAYAGSGARAVLADWLDVRGAEPGPLLWPVDQAGRMTPRRLTSGAVFFALQRRARQAGVPPFSPHDLRRTFISDLLDRGVDIATAQRLAGHANVQTTARYDRRGEPAKQLAADALHLPWPDRQRGAAGTGKVGTEHPGWNP